MKFVRKKTNARRQTANALNEMTGCKNSHQITQDGPVDLTPLGHLMNLQFLNIAGITPSGVDILQKLPELLHIYGTQLVKDKKPFIELRKTRPDIQFDL